MRRLFALLTLLVLAATPAVAANPESGKVSRATPSVSWEGAVTSFQSYHTYAQGQGQCVQPSCDTFTLEVADGPAPLKISVESGDSIMHVEVVKPDGTKENFGGDAKAGGTIKNAANGTYTINVAQNEQTQATHKGTAQLVFPASTPAAPATAPPAPAPGTAPDSTTPPAPAPAVLTLKAGKLKKGRLPVTVGASAPVTKAAVTLKRGKKVVGKGSLARVAGKASMKLKLKGKPKRGRHTLSVKATDEQGRTVTKTISVKI